MTDRKRLLALLLCVGLAAVLCVSTLHIALEADHDCRGENCPICEMIAVNVRLLRTLGLLALITLFFTVLLRARSFRFRRNVSDLITIGTPVTWKIRMNN